MNNLSLEQHILRGHSVKHLAVRFNCTHAQAKAMLIRDGYDLSDIPTDVRSRIATLARSGSTVETIGRETGIRRQAIIRVLGMRHITANYDPPPERTPYSVRAGRKLSTPEDYRVDPWDRPRPVLTAPVEEFPF